MNMIILKYLVRQFHQAWIPYFWSAKNNFFFIFYYFSTNNYQTTTGSFTDFSDDDNVEVLEIFLFWSFSNCSMPVRSRDWASIRYKKKFFYIILNMNNVIWIEFLIIWSHNWSLCHLINIIIDPLHSDFFDDVT